jgi:hypothetical protein
MAKQQDELRDLFKQWQSGRIKDFAGIAWRGELADVPDWYVITAYMPEDTRHVKELMPEERATAKSVIHAFTGIVSRRFSIPVQGGVTEVIGLAWEYGARLKAALPFPSKELAQEFADKIIELPGITVMQVADFLKHLKP